MGIVTGLCNGLSRILWGSLYDRFGYRRCTLAIGATVTIVIATLPLLTLCEKNSSLVQVLWVLLMASIYSAFPGSFSIMATAMAAAFGPKHYRANFGLLFTITVSFLPSSTSSPPLFYLPLSLYLLLLFSCFRWLTTPSSSSAPKSPSSLTVSDS